MGRLVGLVPDGLGHGPEPTGGPVGLGHGAEPSSGPIGLGRVADPIGGAGVLGLGGGCGAPWPCFAWIWAERRIFFFCLTFLQITSITAQFSKKGAKLESEQF